MKKVYQQFEDLIIRHRRYLVVFIFLIQAAVSDYLAFFIRFDSQIPPAYYNLFLVYLPLLLLIRMFFILQAGLDKGLWRYASISDLIKIVNSTTLGSIVFLVTVRYVVGDQDYPRSILVLDWMLFIIISGGDRLMIRVFREHMLEEPQRKKILIIGAGDAGEMIVREMKNNSLYCPIGFIDDDGSKKGLTIHGIPILGGSREIPHIVRKMTPDEILITTTEIQKTIRDIYEICKPFSITIKKLPGINDILGGNVSVPAKIGQLLVNANFVTESQVQEALALQRKEGGPLGAKLMKLGYISEGTLVGFLGKHYGISHMRPISLEDLLQRAPVNSDITFVKEFISGKKVMVTGAGGSIGAELSRQIMGYNPTHLLLFDRYENSLFDIDLELRSQKNGVEISTIIGDIQDAANLKYVFARYTPQIIFHAAAYKHVPLMEHNPVEAVKNNILGTKNLLDASARFGVKNFVMISTDKAVNPTNIMGATKRVAEFMTINMNSLLKTKCSTVRFGNVLGTNGSVVPVFKEQLKKGGPLTVTHPKVERFFMLIPEAVHLVLIAAASGRGGEIFVLDMGERVKIRDLAENFIRLSGFIPYKEIKIEYIGLRPGEKLIEELFDESESAVPTAHEKIMMAIPRAPSMESLLGHIGSLNGCLQNYSISEIVAIIKKIVPNFTYQEGLYMQNNDQLFHQVYAGISKKSLL